MKRPRYPAPLPLTDHMCAFECDYASASDERLMSAYQGGDYKAFEELYRRHSGKVYGFLSRRLQDAQARDEIFQEVFLKLHKGRRRYIPGLPFTAFLFAITRNALIDHHRGRGRSREDLVDAASPVFDEAAACSSPAAAPGSPLDAACLSERDKAVLAMHYMEGLSFTQIAARLGISHASGRQIASRAIRRLRGAFGLKAV